MSPRPRQPGKQRAAPAPRRADARKPAPAQEPAARTRQEFEAAPPQGNQLLQRAMAPRGAAGQPPAGRPDAEGAARRTPAAPRPKPQRRPRPADFSATTEGVPRTSGDADRRDALESVVNGRTHTHGRRTSIERIVVADDARAVEPGQMRKTDFLAALEVDVTEAAERELAPAGRSVGNCPWIPYWFAYYQRRDVAQIARALVKFAPEAAGAGSVGAAIDAVRSRVVRSVRQSLALGRLVDTPAGMPARAFDADAPAPPPAGAPTTDPILNRSEAEVAEGAVAGWERGGNESSSDAGGAARARLGLGGGRPLDAATRGRMESAFGADLSHVRVHSDARGQTAAGRAGARAFAYGGDVAFAPGQHRPGSLVGDALLAHELAHTLQQSSERSSEVRPDAAPRAVATAAIEADADAGARGAVGRLWGGTLGIETGGVRARPALRTGLHIARCGGEPPEVQADTSVGARKTVDVKPIKAEGTSPNAAGDVAFANTRVYPQANVGINALPEQTLTAAETRTLLGSDVEFSERSESSTPTADENRLWARFRSTTVINVIYVSDIVKEGCAGTSTLGLGWENGMAVLEENTSGQAFSHELGHVMGLDHRNRSDNLMHPTEGAGKVKLESDQVTTVRNSSYAR